MPNRYLGVVRLSKKLLQYRNSSSNGDFVVDWATAECVLSLHFAPSVLSSPGEASRRQFGKYQDVTACDERPQIIQESAVSMSPKEAATSRLTPVLKQTLYDSLKNL